MVVEGQHQPCKNLIFRVAVPSHRARCLFPPSDQLEATLPERGPPPQVRAPPPTRCAPDWLAPNERHRLPAPRHGRGEGRDCTGRRRLRDCGLHPCEHTATMISSLPCHLLLLRVQIASSSKRHRQSISTIHCSTCDDGTCVVPSTAQQCQIVPSCNPLKNKLLGGVSWPQGGRSLRQHPAVPAPRGPGLRHRSRPMPQPRGRLY